MRYESMTMIKPFTEAMLFQENIGEIVSSNFHYSVLTRVIMLSSLKVK